jgi:hypothetical protein
VDADEQQPAAETNGVKWAPDTGPNCRIGTVSRNAVAMLFSSSCEVSGRMALIEVSPESSGDLTSVVPQTRLTQQYWRQVGEQAERTHPRSHRLDSRLAGRNLTK